MGFSSNRDERVHSIFMWRSVRGGGVGGWSGSKRFCPALPERLLLRPLLPPTGPGWFDPSLLRVDVVQERWGVGGHALIPMPYNSTGKED